MPRISYTMFHISYMIYVIQKRYPLLANKKGSKRAKEGN